jgi:hypothetical protein
MTEERLWIARRKVEDAIHEYKRAPAGSDATGLTARMYDAMMEALDAYEEIAQEEGYNRGYDHGSTDAEPAAADDGLPF